MNYRGPEKDRSTPPHASQATFRDGNHAGKQAAAMGGELLRETVLALTLFIALTAPPVAVNGGELSGADEASVALSLDGGENARLEELKRDFSLFPYESALRRELIAAYVAAGKRQLKGKLFDEAVESFENARQLSPDNQDLGVLKGIALYGGRRYDEAAVALEQSRRNGGDTVTILLYLGRVYYDSGDLERATDAWDGALAMDPGNKAIRDMEERARREMAIESRMDKDYGSAFVISYDGGNGSELADAVLEVLQSAYSRVGYDLSVYPKSHISVILYRGKEYRTVTAGPEWSGGMYDGKVRLPIGGAVELTATMRGILFHEYTHVAVGELSRGNSPVWLNEGLAEFEGRREISPPLTELERAAKSGVLIPFKSLEGPFSAMEKNRALLAYQQSYSLVDFMVSAYGLHKVREILVNLGNGMGSEAAIAAAFSDYRLDFEAILREWREHIRKEFDTD